LARFWPRSTRSGASSQQREVDRKSQNVAPRHHFFLESKGTGTCRGALESGPRFAAIISEGYVNRRSLLTLTAGAAVAALWAPAAQSIASEGEKFPINQSEIKLVPKKFRRRAVRIATNEPPGTIIVDTRQRYLYLVQPGGTAIRYGIGVGRQGFSWAGTAVIRRKAKWPRWTPPAEMVERDPLAAEWAGGMPGGPRNPLGARALYLFQGDIDTLYRIHGTYQPQSIGKAVSSGCIRLINADVADLYQRVRIGARVVVVQSGSGVAREIKKKRRGLFDRLRDDD